MSEIVIAKILDVALTLFVAGLNRADIVNKVREMEATGATPDEITDALQNMRQQSEAHAQAKIDARRNESP